MIMHSSDEELQELVWQKSCVQLAKDFGVSDNGLKKYCQRRNIKMPPRGYWAKFEAGRFTECADIKQTILYAELVELADTRDL